MPHTTIRSTIFFRPSRRVQRLALVAAGFALLGSTRSAGAGDTVRVSVADDGSEANGMSFAHSFGAMSSSGKIVAFTSLADNLVGDDTNASPDVFVRDLRRATTTRVSVDSDGFQADAGAIFGTVSKSGRYVAYQSAATNLVPGDANGEVDIFFHDRKTGETSRVSVNSAGIEGNGASGGSGAFGISGNGRAVVFASNASNLVAGDTNGFSDVFHHDRKSGVTTRLSVADDGGQSDQSSTSPAPSSSGRVVAFLSAATNLVDGDTNAQPDVFVRNLKKGTTTRVSVSSTGLEADDISGPPAISGNGKLVAFVSLATNLVAGDTNAEPDVFVHDLQTGETTRVSVASDGTEANGPSSAVAVSGKGRTVIFASEASNLVPDDTNGVRDVFVHDLKTGQTVRASVDGAGVESTIETSHNLALNKNGRLALFSSASADLVVGDTNGEADVFVHDLRD